MQKLRKYELVYVLGENSGEEDARNVRDKLEAIIQRFDGEVLEFEDWGERQLAYEIKKNKRGHYFRIIFTALPEAQQELHRMLRLDERIIRFMSLLVKEPKRKPQKKVEEPSSEGEKKESDVNAQLQ